MKDFKRKRKKTRFCPRKKADSRKKERKHVFYQGKKVRFKKIRKKTPFRPRSQRTRKKQDHIFFLL